MSEFSNQQAPTFGADLTDSIIDENRENILDPHALIEELSPYELIGILFNVLAQKPVFSKERNQILLDVKFGLLRVQPLETDSEWTDEAPVSEFNFEIVNQRIKLNRPALINEMQMRFMRSKIYLNNSDELCVSRVLSVKKGVLFEHFEEQIDLFIEESALICGYDKLIQPSSNIVTVEATQLN